MGKGGGVISPLKQLVKFGLGGKQGNGRQLFSWIHIEDLFKIVLFIMDHNELSGAFNCSSPNAVANEVLMKTLRLYLHKKIGLPAAEWLLKIGAVFINTETELVLKSRWVLPQRLLQSGFTFTYPTLATAIEEIL